MDIYLEILTWLREHAIQEDIDPEWFNDFLDAFKIEEESEESLDEISLKLDHVIKEVEELKNSVQHTPTFRAILTDSHIFQNPEMTKTGFPPYRWSAVSDDCEGDTNSITGK